MNAGEIRVDAQQLANAADGINKVIHQLQQLGFAASGTLGRGFTELKLPGLQIGTEGMRGALDGFCERWQWGVRTLVRDANQIGKDLGLSAGAYYEQDKFNADELKKWENAVVGDPRLTERQLSAMSYGDILDAGAAYENPANADFSAAAFEQAGRNMSRSVGDAWHESWTVRALSGQNPLTGK